MGNQSSSATLFNDLVSKNLNNIFISKVNQSVGSVLGSQKIKIQNVNCENTIIEDITQKMVVTYNFNKIAETFDPNTLKIVITNAVRQAAKADSTIESEFLITPNSVSMSSTEIFNANVDKVVNNYSYQEFTNNLNQAQASQFVGIAYLSGKDCTIGSINQTLYMEMITNNISKRLTEAFQQMQAENEKINTNMFGNFFNISILIFIGILFLVIIVSKHYSAPIIFDT